MTFSIVQLQPYFKSAEAWKQDREVIRFVFVKDLSSDPAGQEWFQD